jgi:hypothetical protein
MSSTPKPLTVEALTLQLTQKTLDEAKELLESCRLQIKYLHEKFRETGTGNQLLSQIDSFIQRHDNRTRIPEKGSGLRYEKPFD